MNKMILMLGLLVLWVNHNCHAQTYERLNQDDVVYDVDVVVFARRLAQPSAESYNNAPLLADPARRWLTPWDPQWPLLNFPQPEPTEEPTNDPAQEEWQVPITTAPRPVDALVWVAFANNPSHPVLQRLSVNPNLKPLLHRQWRQPATAFLDPEYVAVSTLPPPTESAVNDPTADANTSAGRLLSPVGPANTFNVDDPYAIEEPNPDYSVDGQVAFSRQRFTHLHVKMNLFRINAAGESIVHAISQQRRVQLGEWQYFDHQQFGVLAKVTEVSLLPPKNEENEHETDAVTGVDDTDFGRLSIHQTNQSD